jgi:putative transposase
MMLRTISIKLDIAAQQAHALRQLQAKFNSACNAIGSIARENRCWNRGSLHHLSYYTIRTSVEDKEIQLGSQMVCNAIRVVCDAYKVLKIKKNDPIPPLQFKPTSSVHFDKRTYSLKNMGISLYTLSGRLFVSYQLGEFQKHYLSKGTPKEAELICKKGVWFFNLVLELPNTALSFSSKKILGIDLGENNLAATSSGKLFGGGQLRHKRDCALNLRAKLQSNGSKSSKQLLKKISGKESRHMKHINHCVSKAIIKEAITTDCDTIAMERLTNIRKRIRAKKRVRSRLHRWSWNQLQNFVQYKAESAGLKVVFVNPAYTSQMCADCGIIGNRLKHKLICKICGIQRHSDLNASQNIRRIAESADTATGRVNFPHVAIA